MDVSSKQFIIIGFGGVAQCTLPLILDYFKVKPYQITLIEFEDISDRIRSYTDSGLKFVHEKITLDNLHDILGRVAKKMDIILDLAWNIDTMAILDWCHQNEVLYLNTSIEIWDPYTHAKTIHPSKKTLYHRHQAIENQIQSWPPIRTTAVLEHGANPGLISHFVKQGLIDITRHLSQEKLIDDEEYKSLLKLIDKNAFNQLAQRLDIRVIHVSERDTQISKTPKKTNEFVNTWSVEGFREEGTTTSEIGWGTHEKKLPKNGYHHENGPRNQIYLNQMGMNTLVASWVPDSSIIGMVIRHGEAYTLSKYLTVNAQDKAIYRPTVHYAYCPSDAAIASLHELRGKNYILQDKVRIMNDDIIKGEDILGALLMGPKHKAWWIGSKLSIEESRRLIPHQNSTTLQVAISIIASIDWIFKHPYEGVCTPENLPHTDILKIAKPYLGEWISMPVDWNPLVDLPIEFPSPYQEYIDEEDPWQFHNFLR